ncbi:hypothetical protein ACFL2H_12425 [Planctomycetota bacterium]
MQEHNINTSAIIAESQTEQRAAGAASTISPTAPFDRRHDLDALRAIAMLLGIVLHAALSFAPIPWVVQGSQQSGLSSVGGIPHLNSRRYPHRCEFDRFSIDSGASTDFRLEFCYETAVFKTSEESGTRYDAAV